MPIQLHNFASYCYSVVTCLSDIAESGHFSPKSVYCDLFGINHEFAGDPKAYI